jgi:hypothetical protein
MIFFVCVGVMYLGEYDVCDVTLSVHHTGQAEKFALPQWESNPGPLGFQVVSNLTKFHWSICSKNRHMQITNNYKNMSPPFSVTSCVYLIAYVSHRQGLNFACINMF